MKRAHHMELVQRINHAYTLLKKDMSSAQVLDCLIKQYGVSRIQAYRYMQLAKAHNKPILVPEQSAVFTVKMDPSLIRAIKTAASSMDLSISKVVKMALEEFLLKQDCGEKKATS